MALMTFKPTSAGHLLLKHTKQMRLLRADLERDLSELAPSSTGGGREEERGHIEDNRRLIAMMGLVFAEYHSDVRHAQSLKFAVPAPSALTVSPAIFERNNV